MTVTFREVYCTSISQLQSDWVGNLQASLVIMVILGIPNHLANFGVTGAIHKGQSLAKDQNCCVVCTFPNLFHL
jgi:hypothetical protein